MDVAQLVGGFVVEVGSRQAWPFLGLVAGGRKHRLYIDADYAVNGQWQHYEAVDHYVDRWHRFASVLADQTVGRAVVTASGDLELDLGDATLVVSGKPAETTGGEPWRFWTQP